MKKISIVNMENKIGGDVADYFLCGAALAIGSGIGFSIGGPAGAAWGFVIGHSVGCAEELL